MQPSTASQPSQRPSTPTQQQPARPMGYRPPFPPGAPSGYRPPIPRPGMSSPNGSSYPGLPANPRPGFIPQQQRPLMRPTAQSPTMSPAARPVVVGSPVISPATVQQEAPVSPQIQHAEHHKKKRMYPEQITKAYSGDTPVSPAYPQQQQPYASPGSVNTQPQFISPMGTPSPYVQPQLQQQQQQAPQQTYAQPQASSVGYNSYGQNPVSQMTSQFGNMSMEQTAVSFVLLILCVFINTGYMLGSSCCSFIRSPSTNCRHREYRPYGSFTTQCKFFGTDKQITKERSCLFFYVDFCHRFPFR